MRRKVVSLLMILSVIYGIVFVMLITVNTEEALKEIERGNYNLFIDDIPAKDMSGIDIRSVVYASVSGKDAVVYTDWKKVVGL